jgi:hypothetical protein
VRSTNCLFASARDEPTATLTTADDVGRADDGRARHDHRSLDRVLQLPHVTRPAVREYPIPGRVIKACHLLVVLPRVSHEKLVRQLFDVPHSLAERWQMDRDDGQPIVEILAKLVVGERFLGVLVRRRHNTDVDVDLLPATKASHLPRLQRAQELHLNVGRHLGDLVEEHRSAVRELEGALLLVRGPGECAFLVTEQLVLEDIFRKSRAVEREERPGRPVALRVKGARHQLLSGA